MPHFPLMLPTLLLLALLAASASAGSLCPPRENIYPCSCANILQSKKIVHTVVSCHRMRDSSALVAIFPYLRSMQIDQFHLVDSFWEAEKAGRSLPSDWLTLLKIKEMEVVDTALADCFACQCKLTCKNSVTTRFTLVNSTASESLCALCDTCDGSGSFFSWTSCLSRLKHFHVSRGRLSSLGADAFPLEMRDLVVLNLTRNRIDRVDPEALSNLKRLTMLDLSHNALELVDFIGQAAGNLEFLDLSWNNIKIIGPIFSHLSSLKTFKIESNAIIDLKEDDWKKAPDSLRYIDINDNPLHCDCSVRFVNSTFHVSALILGTCSTPEEYENSALRRASRFLNERCDEHGSIGTRANKLVTMAMPGGKHTHSFSLWQSYTLE